MADPYLLPNGTLRNRLEITDANELCQAETDLAEIRFRRIDTEGPTGPFTFDRLKETHRYLFQDIYDWAGETRKIDISKDGHSFETRPMIEARGREITKTLYQANELKGLSREDFAGKAADVFGQINQIHPFREGNGRAQRAFIEALALDAGHQLDFSVVSRERMIQASIESSAGRPEMMRRLFDEISDPGRIEKLAKATDFLGRNGFDWNDRYIATTTPGQRYAGVLVGRAGDDVMMRTRHEIFIGHARDIPDTARPGDNISFVARLRDSSCSSPPT
ncbi:MAG: Fic family protein [Azonexus sp.]|nr:Fic family protein [Azonexus sp.]